jgi:hypothetical protein
MSNIVTKEITYLNRYPVECIDICCTSKQPFPQYCCKHDPYTRDEQINGLKCEENHIQKLKGKTKIGDVLIITVAFDIENSPSPHYYIVPHRLLGKLLAQKISYEAQWHNA